MAKLTWGVAETTEKAYTRLAVDLAMTSYHGHATPLTNLATKGANAAYWMFFEVTLIDRLMRNAASLGAASTLDKGGDIVVRNNLVYRIQDELRLAMYTVQDYGVRLAFLIMAWPLILLAYSLGLVDGLAQRSIRRACAGRESSSLYHLSKHLQFASIAFVGAIYVLQPYAIRPEWFFVPLRFFFSDASAAAVDVPEEIFVIIYEHVPQQDTAGPLPFGIEKVELNIEPRPEGGAETLRRISRADLRRTG